MNKIDLSAIQSHTEPPTFHQHLSSLGQNKLDHHQLPQGQQPKHNHHPKRKFHIFARHDNERLQSILNDSTISRRNYFKVPAVEDYYIRPYKQNIWQRRIQREQRIGCQRSENVKMQRVYTGQGMLLGECKQQRVWQLGVSGQVGKEVVVGGAGGRKYVVVLMLTVCFCAFYVIGNVS